MSQPKKYSQGNTGIKPGSATLKAHALTTRPTRWLAGCTNTIDYIKPYVTCLDQKLESNWNFDADFYHIWQAIQKSNHCLCTNFWRLFFKIPYWAPVTLKQGQDHWTGVKTSKFMAFITQQSLKDIILNCSHPTTILVGNPWYRVKHINTHVSNAFKCHHYPTCSFPRAKQKWYKVFNLTLNPISTWPAENSAENKPNTFTCQKSHNYCQDHWQWYENIEK